MKSVAIGVVLAGSGWLLATTGFFEKAPPQLDPSPAPVTTAARPAVAPATLSEVVAQYCLSCHNDQLRTGNLSLQGLDVERAAENAETAEKMIRKLRAGMMPPPGMPR